MGQRNKYFLSKQQEMESWYEDSTEEFSYMVVRINKSGKRDKKVIIEPYCEYEEVSKKRIKAPKGYYKRAKERRKSEIIWLIEKGDNDVW